MKIRRLKLAGFKSFVDPAELRIEPGLTGIVGPNGCGKSNLLEAIRWVMGEASAKSLRGGGMDDVIFAGTERRPSRGFAEVSMLLDSSGSNAREIEIVRRIERGAGSAYRIDGRDVRAKDVALVFADAATGAHSPALVSQGRIGAIIAAKPAERRQMLEEAAGIAGLHVRRKDAETKLRATGANLERLDAVLADMDARAAVLRRQARAAERYRALSDRIRIAEALLIFVRWREAARAAERSRAEAVAAEQVVAEAAEAQRTSSVSKADADRKLAEVRERAQAARDHARETVLGLSQLSAARDRVTARLADLATQLAGFEQDRAREGRLSHDAADALSSLEVEGRAVRERLVAAERSRAPLAERLAQAETASRDAEVAHSQAVAAHAVRHADLRVATAAAAAAEQRLQRAARQRERCAQELAALDRPEPLAARMTAAGLARRDAEARADSARAAIDTAERDRAAASTARDQAGQALAVARAELAALTSEAKALTRSTEQKGNGVVTQVRAAAGYERALGAALGDDLNAPLGGYGARGWRDAPAGDDPALPQGVVSLAEHVDAPAALSRRLRQIAVVDVDPGCALAAGQRIVTRVGHMRRWDGFVTSGEGADAAERLIRLNRLAEIGPMLPLAQAAVRDGEEAGRAAAALLVLADAELVRQRRALADAENASRAASRDEESARASIERLEARRADMAAREAGAIDEEAAAERARSDAEAALRALPPLGEAEEDVRRLLAKRDSARGAALEARMLLAKVDEDAARDAERAAVIKRETAGWKTRSGDAVKRLADLAGRLRAMEEETASLRDRPEQLAAETEALQRHRLENEAEATRVERERQEADALQQEAERAAVAAAEALAAAREVRAGAVARAENQELRRIEMGRVSGERFECAAADLPARAGFERDDARTPQEESAALDRFTADRERIGPVNLVAERELAEIEEARLRLAAERDELGEAVDRLRGSIGSLNREGRARLRAAFEAVDGHFRRLFRTLFEGGEAHLALVDSDDPLEAGLEIMAQPPGKRLSALTLLSGGEQALTAVALIFGLFLTNPAPICVLDEVDAPLDDANVERFCDLLDRMTQETETRYLIVTHNAVTMSRMARLFGVTMIERGVSRLVSVDLGGANRLLAAE
jgi:chromosome segregation protein